MVEGARAAVVIDDDPDVRLMLRMALEALGFVVHESMTGHGGVDLVRGLRPDLITLDLVLPDIYGVEVCRQIRELSDAYLIMITASSDEADRLVGLASGADDYVTKPFSPREVQARVLAMFRRPRSGGSLAPPVSPPTPAAEHSILRHGRLSVDLEARVAWFACIELPLTRLEFDLLVTMAGNPRRVWRQETLLNIVWGGQWSDVQVVEAQIGNLRRKLADAAAEAESGRDDIEAGDDAALLIRTVPGIGYRMAQVERQPQTS